MKRLDIRRPDRRRVGRNLGREGEDRRVHRGQAAAVRLVGDRLDGAGVLTNVAYSDGTPPVRRAYDRLGRLTVVADGLGVQSNRYAADGQVLEAAAAL